jgi:hypothetical protein
MNYWTNVLLNTPASIHPIQKVLHARKNINSGHAEEQETLRRTKRRGGNASSVELWHACVHTAVEANLPRPTRTDVSGIASELLFTYHAYFVLSVRLFIVCMKLVKDFCTTQL